MMQQGDGENRRHFGRPLSRRSLLRSGAATLAAVTGAGRASDVLAQPPASERRNAAKPPYVPRPHPAQYAFRVARNTLDPDSKRAVAGMTVNGSFPGPEIRVRQDDWLRVRVENHLADSPTSLHWHGLLVPSGMDGVPGVSNAAIESRRNYVYEYPLRQSGTYWYHSHYQLQEQIGLFGPLIIEAREEPLQVDHDAVIMLHDWLHESPWDVLAKLRQGTEKPDGSMQGPDLSDVDYDAFLLNGRATSAPWTFEARPGEKIRLRLINAGASTYFRVMLDGHSLLVTHADGLAIRPVEVPHFLIGMGETHDVVVSLTGTGSYTLHAVAQDGSGQAIGVLHTPDAEPRPNRSLPRFDGPGLSDADLRAPVPTTLPKGELRKFSLELQGEMKKYVWMINGQVYPKTDPLLIRRGERVQVELINRTMMWHPMHLHGHFFRLLQGAGEFCPLKHTVNVPPMKSARIEFTADNPGSWIFHCHNLYHLDAGMARIFTYEA